MARTAVVAAEAGLSSPTLKVYNAAGTEVDSISLSVVGSITTKYSGTLSASAGTYTFTLESGGTVIGTWIDILVSGVDPEEVVVQDNPTKGSVRNALAGRWTNQGTGDKYDDVTVGDTP